MKVICNRGALLEAFALGFDSITGGGTGIYLKPISDLRPIYYVVATVAMIMLLLTWKLDNSRLGLKLLSIREDEDAAESLGIPTTRLKILIYVIAGGFFGLAGLFQLSRLRQGDPTVAVGLELDIIAAVIIGGASLSGGVGTILGSMIGALIMAVLRNGSQQMGWPTYFQEIIIGLVIIVAVFLDRLRQGRQT